MTTEAVIEKLRSIIEPYVEEKELLASISPETDLLEDLKINSANLVDIIIDVELAFDIEIDDEAAEKMLKVKDAVAIIQDRVKV